MSIDEIPADYQFWLIALALCVVSMVTGAFGLIVPSLASNSWSRRSTVILMLALLSLLMKDVISLLGDERWLPLAWFAVASAGVLVNENMARLQQEQRRSGLVYVGLLAAATIASAWFVERVHLAEADFAHAAEVDRRFGAGNVRVMDVYGLVTDKGSPIPATRLINQRPPAVSSSMTQDRSFAGFWPHVLEVAPPSINSNCHGWVFTHGVLVICADHVPQILSDNGYFQVSEAKAGDLIIYLNELDGSVAHTGVVKMVEDGHVLVQSKWGSKGCYLHEPQHSIYGTRIAYYRSSRPGHLLKGLESSQEDVLGSRNSQPNGPG